jgi:chromosome segregation ATPase
MEQIDAQLSEAIKRRNTLESEVQRIRGRLEAAEAGLADVEADCEKRGIDPDQLDKTIEVLTSRYTDSVQEITTQISEAEVALAPFLGDTNED